MKRLLIYFFFCLMITACNRAASASQPTQPVANFPTIAPNRLPLCKTSELQISSNSNATDGSVILGVTLTNKSQGLCTLSNPPIVNLVDTNQKAIDVKNILTLPAQAQPAPAFVQLAPGESVIASLIWDNYCQNPAIKIENLLLTIGKDQTLKIEMNILTIPRCDAKKEPSTFKVGPYSVPP